ncbi:hypothetical protein PSTT_11152 [Puccinia striiformis]|uniref:BED-type domain-containing protein n=1 Tax=Puccinia striiformis TaxID=27350 RepID=A0A2S4V1C5_9BASI|nr:hypothetical protein PSTT_11152 [Puccinia striiformis]
MGNSKKRHKQLVSPSSSVADIPVSEKEKGTSKKKRSRTVIDVVDNSDEDQQVSDSETPASTQNSKGKNLSDEDKLKKARQVHVKQLSTSYAYFNPPHLSDSLDKHRQRMLAYPCKVCGKNTNRRTYDSSPTNLSKHVVSCEMRQKETKNTQKLAALGISGTGDVDPRENTVSDNIGRLNTAGQEKFIESLKNHNGAMYLGLDAWQSPNGFDILGTGKSHTGVYLAETVRVIVEKFGIRDKVILQPFRSHKRNETILTSVDQEQYPDKDDEDADPAGPNDQIRMCTTGDSSDEDEDDNEHKLLNKENILASELISDNEIKLEDEDLIEMSDEDKDNQYTSTSCKLTLAKFRAVSRKLNKSPNSKSLFKELCHDLECLRPHNVGRDVLTRWNSTLEQLSSLIQCSPAILEWQKDKRYGTARQHHINQNNLDLAHDLVEVLQPFHEITLQVLIRGSAQIADIVFFIDQITSHLSSTISNKYDDYPPALRNTCRAGLQFTKKYYTLTDCSPLYRVATQWQPKWIEESIRLTRDMWETNYKPPPPQPTTSQRSNPGPKPPKGVLAGLAGASEARGGNTPTNPIHMWLAVGLCLTDEGQPIMELLPCRW